MGDWAKSALVLTLLEANYDNDMGMRRNVALKFDEEYNAIYFYTHWGAATLEDTLRNALKRGRERWDDPPYLARIIFSEMIQDEVMDTLGYGIAPYVMDDEFPTIAVDLRQRTVNGVPFQEFTTFAPCEPSASE